MIENIIDILNEQHDVAKCQSLFFADVKPANLWRRRWQFEDDKRHQQETHSTVETPQRLQEESQTRIEKKATKKSQAKQR